MPRMGRLSPRRHEWPCWQLHFWSNRALLPSCWKPSRILLPWLAFTAFFVGASNLLWAPMRRWRDLSINSGRTTTSSWLCLSTSTRTSHKCLYMGWWHHWDLWNPPRSSTGDLPVATASTNFSLLPAPRSQTFRWHDTRWIDDWSWTIETACLTDSP